MRPVASHIVALLLLQLVPFAAASAGEPSEPQNEITISVDPDLSLETGADLTFSMVSLLARGEEWTFDKLAGNPRLRRATRAFWGVFFDVPVAWWFGVWQHEAHGHGGRAREFGSSTTVHMGSPWERRSSYATFSPAGRTNIEIARIFAGGSESNGYAATLLEREMVAGRPMRPFELLYVVSNRAVTSRYVLTTTPDPVDDPFGFWSERQGGGDVANYLGYLHLERFGDDGIDEDFVEPLIVRQYERMEREAIWNALDPGVWLSLYAAARAGWRGDSVTQVPTLRLAGRRFLPVFSADWMPRGTVASLELVFGEPLDGERAPTSPRWYSFVVRYGHSFDDSAMALGAATERFAERGNYRFGGEAEIWDDPDGSGTGGGFRLRITATEGFLRGAFADVGAKTRGHWPGRPAESGPFVRFGVHLAL